MTQPKPRPLYFETGNFTGFSRFLPDEEYARALDCLVKGCCDILITNGAEREEDLAFFLGKRCVFPQKDWWYPTGGRMRPGEKPFNTAQRIIKRELGISNLEESSFSLIGYYCYTWELRQQEPQNNGTADISCVLSLTLEPQQLASYKADKSEYQEHKWVSYTKFDRKQFHPALVQSIDDYVNNRKYQQLVALAKQESTTNSELGLKFREFLSRN